jgi:hypothetical protein
VEAHALAPCREGELQLASNRRASVRADAPAISDQPSSVRVSDGSASRRVQTRAGADPAASE